MSASSTKKQEIKKSKTFTVRLSKFELVHLRDLFNIKLPLDLKSTVSEALAEAEDRSLIETNLWLKLARSCKEANVPLDNDAPDFVCAAMSTPPPVGVFRIAQEPCEAQECDDEGRRHVLELPGDEEEE